MINLLPPKRVLNIKTARNNTVLKRYIELTIIGMLIIIAGAVLAYALFTTEKENVQKTVDLNQQKISKLEPVQKQAEELSATVNTISGLLSRNIKFSEMLTNIGGVMPDGSVLTGLQFSIQDIKSPLVVSAQVDNEQKAAVLRNNLAGSELFEKADIQSITKNEEGDTTAPSIGSVPVDSSTTENSLYKFTTVINAYFKPSITGVKR